MGKAFGLQLTHRMETPQKCIQLTFYESDVFLSNSQISKKMTTRWLRPGALSKSTKIHQNKKILPLRHSLSSINIAQWSKTFLYHSITLKTFKNDIIEAVLEKKTQWLIHCFTGSMWVGEKEN